MVPLFCWFYHFLESRAEICQIFGWYFGPNDDTKRTFEINWPLAAWTLLLWVINLQQVTGKQNSTQCRIMYCCLCLTVVTMILEFPTLNLWEIYCSQQIALYCIYILYINRTTKIKPFYSCKKNLSLGFWSK